MTAGWWRFAGDKPGRLRGCLLATASLLLALGATSDLPATETAEDPAARSSATLPPVPPPPDNPVKKFKDLLALDAAGREAALQGRTEWQRSYLREHLAEFDALTATEREVRLGLMHLRYYMLWLLRLPAAQRGEHLKDVPADDRGLLAERLREWEKLPADQQQELLQNEAVLSQLAWFETSSDKRRQELMGALSPQRRQEVEADMQRWRDLPEGQRQRMTRNFSRFFELSDRGRQRALERVAETDRAKIERAMEALEKLPPDERAQCLEALNRYAAMAPEDRSRFLENAARWRNMSPEERRAWRRVASHVAPGRLLPPRPPSIPPPLPRGLPAGGQPAKTTNLPSAP